MLAVFMVALLVQQASADAPVVFDASRVVVGEPKTIAEIDTRTVKGELVCLAWSDDGATIYLRAAEYDRWHNERAHHYFIPVAGGAIAATDGTPQWAAAYWMWKSGVAAPGVPEMRMETDTQTQMVTAVGSVRDGGMSQSRGDPSQSQVSRDYASAQQVATVTIKLKGVVIAESANKSIPAGLLWGWAPAPVGGLAFVDGKKRLVLIDRAGRTFVVPGTGEVLLPAWSPDGRRIAYVQRKDKKTFVLNCVEAEIR